MLAGLIANHIFYDGKTLLDFKPEIVAAVVFLLLLVLGPLCVFAPRLAQVKRQGLLEYGALASRYVDEFDQKWLRGGAPLDEPLVGSGDIQSLNDLAGSFEVVTQYATVSVQQDRCAANRYCGVDAGAATGFDDDFPGRHR